MVELGLGNVGTAVPAIAAATKRVLFVKTIFVRVSCEVHLFLFVADLFGTACDVLCLVPVLLVVVLLPSRVS